jgi:predicted RNase H-like HicB family nuclease
MNHQEPITTAEYTYLAVFEPAEEGGYVVRFPSLPGIVTEGETLDEARAMATDLLTGYLELLRERGKPLPASDPAGEPEPIREPLTVKLRAV